MSPKTIICIYQKICFTSTKIYFISTNNIFHIYQKYILYQPISFYFAKVRIEFETLVLADPNKNGVCDQEYIEVRVIHTFIYNIYIRHYGSSSQQVTRKGVTSPAVPRLCGLLSGQHVIYDQDPGAGPARLVVRRTAASSRWRIKIVQLEATDPGIAPRQG